MDGDARRSGLQDRSPPADLHGSERDPVRPGRGALTGHAASAGEAVRRVCWIDGRIASLDEPVVRADDGAFAEGRGCYTSARVESGRVRFADRHALRIARGARDLGLGRVDPERVVQAFAELAEAALPDGRGILRLQASRDGAGALHLVGVPRAVGPESDAWTAIVAPLAHDGAVHAGGLKVTSRLTLSLAVDAAARAGADEALLCDAAGLLVEGTRSSVFAVGPDGALVTPPLSRGGVAGIAREVLLERIPEIVERDVHRDALPGLRELVAANAVRGARPVTRLDASPVGDGRPGPWSRRLEAALAEA